jgi:inner membrane transporter RhtA
MARLPRATYALLVALLPAVATVIGAVVLARIPTPIEPIGSGLVIAGVAVRPRRVGGRSAATAAFEHAGGPAVCGPPHRLG